MIQPRSSEPVDDRAVHLKPPSTGVDVIAYANDDTIGLALSVQDERLDVEPVPDPANVPPSDSGGSDNLPVPRNRHSLPSVNGKPKSDRGTRLPDGWEPDRAVIEQMRAHVGLRAEHRKFGDYWAAQPGAKGRKVDWNATWRNWIAKPPNTLGPDRTPIDPAVRCGHSAPSVRDVMVTIHEPDLFSEPIHQPDLESLS